MSSARQSVLSSIEDELEPNAVSFPLPEFPCASTMLAQGQQIGEQGGPLLARRRYQNGSLFLRGGSWVLRWREDVIENGAVRRIYRSEVLGDKSEYPTRRLALRAAERSPLGCEQSKLSRASDSDLSTVCRTLAIDGAPTTQTINPSDDSFAYRKVPHSVFGRSLLERYKRGAGPDVHRWYQDRSENRSKHLRHTSNHVEVCTGLGLRRAQQRV